MFRQVLFRFLIFCYKILLFSFSEVVFLFQKKVVFFVANFISFGVEIKYSMWNQILQCGSKTGFSKGYIMCNFISKLRHLYTYTKQIRQGHTLCTAT